MINKKLNETPTTETEIANDNEKQVNKVKVNSRKERKRNKKERAQNLDLETDKELDDAAPKKTFWVQLRILPIWLRIILVTVLLAVVIIIGLRFGYSFIGDGNAEDVLKKETWTHILDIIKGKE